MINRLWHHKGFFLVIVFILVMSLIGVTSCKPTTETYTLTTSASPAGGGSVSPSGGEYESGIQVTLRATPASGYDFDYWAGSASGTSSTLSITMDSDKSITAHFKTTALTTMQTYTLTTNTSPAGGGSVSPSSGEYESNTQVTLRATPATGYDFDHWGGSASGTSSTLTITMDSDKSVTAYFEAVPTTPEILFSDDFSDKDSGWITYSGSDGEVRYRDGYLYIKDNTVPAETMYGEAQHYFTDFIVEVETQLIGGTDDNWHVVACRWTDEENYYAFGISADGYYQLLKMVNGNKTTFCDPTSTPYIDEGLNVTNLIRVECVGSSLSLSVNGHLLKEVTDTTFTGGDICLAANSLAGTYTEVIFDNIVVTEP